MIGMKSHTGSRIPLVLRGQKYIFRGNKTISFVNIINKGPISFVSFFLRYI